jgi:hypothetical protein
VGKKCYIGVGPILFICRATSDLNFVEIIMKVGITLKSSNHGNKEHNGYWNDNGLQVSRDVLLHFEQLLWAIFFHCHLFFQFSMF